MSLAASAFLLFAAFATAILSGVLGMGGGMLLLGVMASLLPSAAVVPIHGVVQLGSNSTRSIVLREHIRWRLFALYVPFLAIGVFLATLIWSGDKLGALKPFIGVFILFYLLMRIYKPKWKNPPMYIYPPLGVLVGFLSIFVGATGPFIAPFFFREEFSKEEVIATKAACQTAGHCMKIPAFLALGFAFGDYGLLLVLLVAMVILGTLVGKRLLNSMSETWFNRLFIGLLILLAIRLLIGGYL